MFLEVLIAKILKPKLKYVAKVPGDIVWERSRNMGRTHLSINDFQKSRLHIRDYVQRIFFTLSLRMAYKVIVPSIELSEMCIYWGVNPNKITVIGNAVDENHFKPLDLNLSLIHI